MSRTEHNPRPLLLPPPPPHPPPPSNKILCVRAYVRTCVCVCVCVCARARERVHDMYRIPTADKHRICLSCLFVVVVVVVVVVMFNWMQWGFGEVAVKLVLPVSRAEPGAD